MRLLNTSLIKNKNPGDAVKLEEFFGSQIPPYVILSHTWDNEEVTFQEITSSTGSPYKKAGFSKIRGCCVKAAEDGYKYVWIDTCCIDKTSSAELSEAINSMYKWYQQAAICYAYLSDIATAETISPFSDVNKFKNSKWFTRGWTLQELIAPRSVEFYARDWTDLGTKSSRQDEIFNITGIDVRILDGDDPAICNVAERLSWAASRTTTRIEDVAYSLLGLFQVHLPLLYGEGERALIRLQEEILKTTEDFTLLARGADNNIHGVNNKNALASALSEYQRPSARSWRYSDLVLDKHTWTDASLCQSSMPVKGLGVAADVTPTLTAKGLHICLPLLKDSTDGYHAYIYCRLNVAGELLCIPLRRDQREAPEANLFERICSGTRGFLTHYFLPATQLESFTLKKYLFSRNEKRLFPYYQCLQQRSS